MDIQEQNDFIKLQDSSEESDSMSEQSKDNEYLSIDTLTPLPIPPWVSIGRKYSRNFITMLDEEIMDFVSYVKPTRAERIMRQFTLQRLRNVLENTWPNAVLNCFGSFETELYLPSSDLDCVVMEPSARVPGCLYVLHDQMMRAQISSRIDVISKSKVPIIKYVDALTHISVDVSFNMSNGIETAKIVKSFVQDKHIGEAVKHLMLLLKQFLVQRHLNEVFTGGLGSYALLCMITSFLRMHPIIVSGEIDPMENLGILLIEFFELYGKNFNYPKVGIELTQNSARYFRRDHSSYRSDFRPSVISIRDPQDPSNDISSGSYNFLRIKTAFQKAFSTLTSMIGSAYDHNLTDAKKREKYVQKFTDLDLERGYMITLLGSILSLSRSVLEQREFLEIQYEKYVNGELNDHGDAGYIPSIPVEIRKRKRSDERDVVFVAESSESDVVDNIKGKVDKAGHQTKRQRHEIDEEYFLSQTGKVSAIDLEEDGLASKKRKKKKRKRTSSNDNK